MWTVIFILKYPGFHFVQNALFKQGFIKLDTAPSMNVAKQPFYLAFYKLNLHSDAKQQKVFTNSNF